MARRTPCALFADRAIRESPLPGLPAAQEKHCLLAQEIPEPPRGVEPNRGAPGIERDSLLHLGADNSAQFAEILDAAEVNIGRLVPGIGQVVGAWHPAGDP